MHVGREEDDLQLTGTNRSAGRGLPDLRRLLLTDEFAGHRLCEEGTSLVEESPRSWREPGAVDKAEWVNQIRVGSAITGPYQVSEGFHPNYWGQLALRNCLRWAYRSLSSPGAPSSGRCVPRAEGLNSRGEPKMHLVP